jgi:hypothetical protein
MRVVRLLGWFFLFLCVFSEAFTGGDTLGVTSYHTIHEALLSTRLSYRRCYSFFVPSRCIPPLQAFVAAFIAASSSDEKLFSLDVLFNSPTTLFSSAGLGNLISPVEIRSSGILSSLASSLLK